MAVTVGGRRVAEHPSADAASVVDLARTLSFDRCVSRRLVHRRSVAEVFVCDRLPVAADVVAVAVTLPRAHALWSDRVSPYHDPSMVVEAVRQAAIVVAHDHFDLPVSHIMIAKSFDMQVTEIAQFVDDARNPLEGVVLIAVESIPGADGSVGGMRFDAAMFVTDRLAAEVGGELRFAAEADFAVARAMAATGGGSLVGALSADDGVERVPASSVGRSDRRNVAIAGPIGGEGGAAVTYRLLVDQDNAVFFDHELDHVPGLLMTEGARQAATIAIETAPGWRALDTVLVTGGGGRFDGFAELDRPTDVVVDDVHVTGTSGTAEVAIRQASSTIAEISVRLTAIESHARSN